MKYFMIDYISERINKRRYRPHKKSYREKPNTPMDDLFDMFDKDFATLEDLETGHWILVHVWQNYEIPEKEKTLDRFVLSYIQWCRCRNYEWELVSRDRELWRS